MTAIQPFYVVIIVFHVDLLPCRNALFAVGSPANTLSRIHA
jgi:hypothetical protein